MLSLRYNVFFEVAFHLSFSKAAETLFISQPAVSKHIKMLESEIGIALFERKGTMVNLTASGERLYKYLHKARAIARQAQSDLEIIKRRQTAKGSLKIGASTTIALYVMPKVLAGLHKQYPKVTIQLVNRNSENILNALLNHEIDLAVVEAHYQINAVHYQPFMQDEIIAVCATDSGIPRGPITVDRLGGLPMALRERGSGTLATVAKHLARHGLKVGDLAIIARLGGTAALKNYLHEVDAVGFLSRLAVADALQRGTLREVPVAGLSIVRHFGIVMRKGEESTGLTRAATKALQAWYNHRL